jgi:uncharacterized membrane protein
MRRRIDPSQLIAAGVAAATILALIALAVGELTWVDDLGWFLSENRLARWRRIGLLSSILGAALGGVLVTVMVAIAWGDRGTLAVGRAAKLLSPLGLGWAFVALAASNAWQNRPLPFLLLLGGSVLLLERSIRLSSTVFPCTVLDEWGARYDRLPARIRRLAPLALVLGAASAYTAYTGYWSIEEHRRLATASFDLGILDNVIFNAMSGYGLRAPVLFGPEGGSHLAGHANFVMYLFLPLYWLAPRAETLLVLQSVFVGFAAIPLYGFAKSLLPRWSAALLSVAYLLYAPLHGPNFYDFHWLPLSIFFLFCLFWALSTNRNVLVWVFWALCVLIREDVPVGLAAVGAFLALSGHRVRTGAVMTVLSTMAFVLIKFVIMPAAGTWWFAGLYDDLMPADIRSYGGVVSTILTNPAYLVSTVLTEKKLAYALHLLVPLAFLPLRRWLLLLGLLPGFFFTLMTTGYDPTVSIAFQYTSHWIPYLFGATALALTWMGGSPEGVIRRRAALTAVVAGIVLHSLSYGAILRPTDFRGGFHIVPFHVTEQERSRYRDLLDVIALIPPDASVAATDPETPHISNRTTAYALRVGAGDADYLLIRKDALGYNKSRQNAQAALNEHDYGLVTRVSDFFLFKRGHQAPDTIRALAELRLRPGAKK